jgi:hypothetical protein
MSSKREVLEATGPSSKVNAMYLLSDEPRLQLIWLLPEMSRDKLFPGLSGVGSLFVDDTYWRLCCCGFAATGLVDFSGLLPITELPQLERKETSNTGMKILNSVRFMNPIYASIMSVSRI